MSINVRSARDNEVSRDRANVLEYRPISSHARACYRRQFFYVLSEADTQLARSREIYRVHRGRRHQKISVQRADDDDDDGWISRVNLACRARVSKIDTTSRFEYSSLFPFLPLVPYACVFDDR